MRRICGGCHQIAPAGPCPRCAKRTTPPALRRHGAAFEKAKRIKRKSVNACQRCASRARLEVHHINGNPFDNRQENLVVLCHGCHLAVEGRVDRGGGPVNHGRRVRSDSLPTIREKNSVENRGGRSNRGRA